VQDAVNAILNSATSTAGSGIDVQSTVNALLQIDAQPEQQMLQQVAGLNAQTTALTAIQSDLTAFQTTVQALSDPFGAFGAVAVQSNNNSVVSATAVSGAALGTHTIAVNSLATTSAYYTGALPSTLPTGGFDLSVGPNSPAVTIPVDSADNTTTLNGLVTCSAWGLRPRCSQMPPGRACRWSARLPARRAT
jgi:flagellar hook-associated protein 2